MADPYRARFVQGLWELAWEDGKHGVIADAAGGKMVCIVANVRPEDLEVFDDLNDVRKANAQLISAAPTLLAVCEEVLETLTQINFFEGERYELTEDIEMLRKAIAKARGEANE